MDTIRFEHIYDAGLRYTKVYICGVGFPRDGTSRCPFVPGQKNFLVPVSLCPGTRAGANVPGQTPLSRDVPGQNEFKNFKKMTKFPAFGHHFPVFGHHFPVLENPLPVLEQRFLF